MNDDDKNFLKALEHAAREDGAPRLTLLRIRALELRPKKLKALRRHCESIAIEEFTENPVLYGNAITYTGDSYQFNWEGLTNFLKEILPIVLPIILKLLGM